MNVVEVFASADGSFKIIKLYRRAFRGGFCITAEDHFRCRYLYTHFGWILGVDMVYTIQKCDGYMLLVIFITGNKLNPCICSTQVEAYNVVLFI